MKSTPSSSRAIPARTIKTKSPKRRGGIYAVVAIAAVLAYIAIAPRLRRNSELAGAVQTTKETVPLVSVEKVTYTIEKSDLSLPSNIQAVEQTTLNARVSGYLGARYVDIGSRVKKGDVLAIIESPEVDQQVSQSEADLSRTEAGIGQADADVNKMRAAISTASSEQSRNVSDVMQARADLSHLQAKEMEAQAAVKITQSKVDEAKHRLTSAEADLTRAKVVEAINKKTADRWHQLEQAEAVSGQEADEKEADYESSIADVAAATANVSTATATLEAANEAVLGAQSDAKAAEADVQSGKEKIGAAQAALQASKSDVSAAESNLQASKSAGQAAVASRQATAAGLRRVGDIQSFEKIVAPFSGVITSRNVDVGDLVNPSSGAGNSANTVNAVASTGLFGLAETDVLRAVLQVPEDQIGLVSLNQSTQVTVKELPGKSFHGEVYHIAGALDATTRTLMVEVRIDNHRGALKPGMFGQITFLNGTERRLIEVPADAMIFDNHGTRVATVKSDGTLHFVDVTVANDRGDKIEIATGLEPGETIVTNPDDSLTEGEKVQESNEQE
jgi:RND family efflux transporter MFP subunit